MCMKKRRFGTSFREQSTITVASSHEEEVEQIDAVAVDDDSVLVDLVHTVAAVVVVGMSQTVVEQHTDAEVAGKHDEQQNILFVDHDQGFGCNGPHECSVGTEQVDGDLVYTTQVGDDDTQVEEQQQAFDIADMPVTRSSPARNGLCTRMTF